MSKFNDEAFSLENLRNAPPAKSLSPRALVRLELDLHFQGWRDEVREFLDRSSRGQLESSRCVPEARLEPLEAWERPPEEGRGEQ